MTEKKKLTVAKPTHVHNYKYTGERINQTCVVLRCRCGDEIEKDVS
jgi:hypothetical protein